MLIELHDEHKDPKDCQVIIALTGSKEFIQTQLFRMYSECMDYDKPGQGTLLSSGGIRYVSTSVWRGRKY